MKEFLQNNVTLVVAGVVVLAVLLWWTGVLEGCNPAADGASGVSQPVTVPVVTPSVPSVNSTNAGITTPAGGIPVPEVNTGTLAVPGNVKSSQ
jgi:hypothetical protein